MNSNINLLIYLVSFLIFITLIYGQFRVSIRSSRILKRMVLFFTGFFSKNMAEEFIRGIFLLIISLFMMVFIYVNNELFIGNILMKITLSNFIIILVAFIAFVEILFIVTTVINLIFFNKDLNKIFKDINWLKVDLNNFIYTGYIRPLLVAIFEVVFFFNIIFGVLINKFRVHLWISILITVLFYCYGKFVMVKGKDKKAFISIFALAISLSTILLINVVNSSLVGVVFMYVILTMIAFKDVKIRL